MAITRWDPFGEMLSMQRDMDRLVRRLGMGRTEGEGPSGAWMPRIDVKTSRDDVIVHAEVPGMKPEDIVVEVADGVLSIKGERKAESKKSDEGWIVRERSYGAFERTLSLPEGVNVDAITADCTDGVLEIRIPKAAKAIKPKTRRIALGPAKKR